MELHDYLALIRRSSRWLVGTVVVTTTLTTFVVARTPARFEGSVSVTVFQDVPGQTPVSEPYQFDSYYTLQAASLIAEQLKNRLADPAFVGAAFARAAVAPPPGRLTELGRVFAAKRLEPAGVLISYQTGSAETVRAVLTAAAAEAAGELETLQSSGAFRTVKLQTGDPYVVSYRPSPLIAALIAVLVSALLATSGIFLAEFARPRQR
jgi:hypothetical protein